MLYTGIAVARHPSGYFGDFPDRLLYMDNLLGSIALALLTLMTALSNRPAVRLLGYGSWKRIMRCGYLAFALLAVRAWLMEKGLWLDWLNDPISLAPPRLILAVFALVVISTRLLSVKPSSTKLAGEPLLKRQV